jgi:hypothetical protein
MAGNGPQQQVRIDGLNQTIRSLRKAGVEGSEVKKAMSESSRILADELRQQTPVKTGALAASTRPGNAIRKASARQGGRRPMHYAPFVNWGTLHFPPRYHAAAALRKSGRRALRAVEQNINQIIVRNGLK